MLFDPTEQNPMWASRATLVAGTPLERSADIEGEPACRVALRASAMAELLEGGAPSDRVVQLVTWDTPRALLADDAALAERVRAAGVPITSAAGTYAERQWDAREALEEAAHRYYDHGESHGVRGMTTRQPGVAVALVLGAPLITSLLRRLLVEVERAGLVLDARDAHEPRVFEMQSLERDRLLLVQRDSHEEHRSDADIEKLLQQITPHGGS